MMPRAGPPRVGLLALTLHAKNQQEGSESAVLDPGLHDDSFAAMRGRARGRTQQARREIRDVVHPRTVEDLDSNTERREETYLNLT